MKNKENLVTALLIAVVVIIVFGGILISVRADRKEKAKVAEREEAARIERERKEAIARWRAEEAKYVDGSLEGFNLNTTYVMECPSAQYTQYGTFVVDKTCTPAQFYRMTRYRLSIRDGKKVIVDVLPDMGYRGLNEWMTVKKIRRTGSKSVEITVAYGVIRLTASHNPSCFVDFGAYEIVGNIMPSQWRLAETAKDMGLVE